MSFGKVAINRTVKSKRTPIIGPKPLNNEDSLECSKAVDELRTLVRSEVPEEVDGLPLGRELDRLEEAWEV